MTTLDHRPAPSRTINGEVVDSTVHPIPANPHRFGTNASGLIVMVVAVGLASHIDGSVLEAGVAGGALATAIALFLTKLTRFNAFAEANDPFHNR